MAAAPAHSSSPVRKPGNGALRDARYLKMTVDTTEKRLSCDHFAAGFQFVGRAVQKRNRVLQMIQHIGERNNIKAIVLNRVQLVDFVLVKHEIEIIFVADGSRTITAPAESGMLV